MEAIIIAFIVVLAATFIDGPLGWGIVLTAILYFVFETVSSNIQKSQKKMRKEMDMILNKNEAEQEQIENALSDADALEEGDGSDAIQPGEDLTKELVRDKGSVQSMPTSLDDVNAPGNVPPPADTIVERVDAAAGVLDALEQRTNSAPE